MASAQSSHLGQSGVHGGDVWGEEKARLTDLKLSRSTRYWLFGGIWRESWGVTHFLRMCKRKYPFWTVYITFYCPFHWMDVIFFLLFSSTAFLLSCPFPLSPESGGVTVTDIHPGGQAHFHCDPGFQVRGHEVATCVNTTQPHWSTPEPQCVGQQTDLILN